MYVIDTNILVAGLFSRRGASNRVLRLMLARRVPFALSPALVFEYEDVLTRPEVATRTGLDGEAIGTVLDALCTCGVLVTPRWLLRPLLADAGDHHVLECAVAARATAILTLNARDFTPAASTVGVDIIGPGAYLAQRRETGDDDDV